MRIALCVERFPVRSETFVLRQARQLLERGHDVRILTFRRGDDFDHPGDAELLSGRVTGIGGPWSGRWAWPLARRMLASAAGRRIATAILAALAMGERASAKALLAASSHPEPGRFDAVVAHFGPVGVKAMHLRRAGILDGPLAVIFHGYDLTVATVLRKHRRGYAALGLDADLLLPISTAFRDRLLRLGADPGRLRVLRMGVDIDPTRPPDFSRALHAPLRVLSIGRFVEKKGLTHAIAGVKGTPCPAELSIVGYGELEAELRAQAASAGGNPVRFLGRLPHPAVLEAIEAADVVLLPSVTAADGDSEGIPVTLMEAMARGTLVVSTRHSGIPELIEDGRSGFLVGEACASEIAAVLSSVARGSLDIAGIRRSAYDTIAGAYDASILADALDDLLRDLRKGRPRP